MAVSGAEAFPRRRRRGWGPWSLRSRGGFLLVEVLVAMVLLGVGLSGALVLLGQAARAMESAELMAWGAPVVAGEALFVPQLADGHAREPVVELEWWWDDGGLQVLQRRGEGAPFAARSIRVPWVRPGANSPLEEGGP